LKTGFQREIAAVLFEISRFEAFSNNALMPLKKVSLRGQKIKTLRFCPNGRIAIVPYGNLSHIVELARRRPLLALRAHSNKHKPCTFE
jgi:hypothetical protein